MSESLGFVRSGRYIWFSANFDYRSSDGNYWSSYTSSTGNSRNQYFYRTLFNPQYGYLKGVGFTIR